MNLVISADQFHYGYLSCYTSCMLGFSFVYIDYCRIYINRSSYNNCNIQHLIVYNNYMYILVIKSYNNFYFES